MDYEKLLSDGPYKEKFRKDMIVWGETSRRKNYKVFADIVLRDARCCDVLIVSDARRATDMKCFDESKSFRTITVRVRASEEERARRGFKFKSGVDDAESECGLDNYHHDVVIDNEGLAALSRNDNKPILLDTFRTTPQTAGGVDDQLYTLANYIQQHL